jgi:hypothetical protein
VDFQVSEFLALQDTQEIQALKVPAARKAILTTWEVKDPQDPVRPVLPVLALSRVIIITDNLLASHSWIRQMVFFGLRIQIRQEIGAGVSRLDEAKWVKQVPLDLQEIQEQQVRPLP